MKCGEKLGKLMDLEITLEGESTESTIVEFGSRFARKSMSEVDKIFRMRELRKRKIKIEID